MTILLIEDDEHKRERVAGFLRSTLEHLRLFTAHSVQGGLSMLQRTTPGMVLLDMSLPIFDYSADDGGFQHLSYGGKDILEYLDRCDLEVPVVVLTAFDRFGGESNAVTLEQLDQQLRQEFPHQYVGSVWYSALEDSWQEDLLRLIAESPNPEEHQ